MELDRNTEIVPEDRDEAELVAEKLGLNYYRDGWVLGDLIDDLNEARKDLSTLIYDLTGGNLSKPGTDLDHVYEYMRGRVYADFVESGLSPQQAWERWEASYPGNEVVASLGIALRDEAPMTPPADTRAATAAAAVMDELGGRKGILDGLDDEVLEEIEDAVRGIVEGVYEGRTG